MRQIYWTAIALIVTMGNSPAFAQSKAAMHAGVSRSRVVEQPVTPVKATDILRVERIDFAAHQAITPHAHPVPTLSYVLSGEALYQGECGQARIVRAGDTFYMPAGVPIIKLDTGDQPLEFLAIFLRTKGDIDDGDPRMTVPYPMAGATTDRNGVPCRK